MFRRNAESLNLRMSTPSISITPELRIEGAVKQRNCRRFAGAGGADEGNRLARHRFEVQIRHSHPLPVIGERNVLELDEPAEAARIDRIRPVANGRNRVPYLKEFA